MRLSFLALAALCLAPIANSMSTCKTLDLETIKKKRIEAIRGQILSKLRMEKEPKPEDRDVDVVVPKEILSLYNSTLEMTEEQSKTDTESPSRESEEYFAKEVHKFIMASTINKSLLFFNMTEMKKSISDFQRVSKAELWLRVIGTPTLSERLEMYQVTNGQPKYLGFNIISKTSNHWISFDVTETLKEWLQAPEEQQSFMMKSHCSCTKDDESVTVKILGVHKDRGDIHGLSPLTAKPYILTMSAPPNNLSSSRKKRATDETCDKNSEACCMRQLYIDFRKDLGWKWIHHPKGYYANYCMGSCTYIWNAENKYSQVMALYKHHNPGASAQPCCVPDAMQPLPIAYYVGRTHKVELLSGMMVKTCKCS